MKFEELKEFKKDIKKILKKHRSISEDIEVIKKVLDVKPNERPPFSYKIDGLGIESCIIKIKKIASKSFKGKGVNSGHRTYGSRIRWFFKSWEPRTKDEFSFS